MLVITYDEDGGFFDHVAPGPAGTNEPAPFSNYGVRVPAFVVSPWAKAGACAHDVFDHTSILRTILALVFGDAWPGGGRRVAAARASGCTSR